jgi:CDP-2,3-bis-(O-geranylgeranyl)-sn-glycerol synthase
MAILHELFFALWFFLPAGVANMMPVFAAFVPGLRRWNYPMDGYRTFRGQRVFGDHKTVRGLVTGVVFATLTLWLQQTMVGHSDWLAAWTAHVDYATLPVLILGPLFALGALLGDAVESFFKRQRHTPPGEGWFPFDQTDYIVGAAVATAPFVQLGFWQYVWLICLWLVLHVVATVVGYYLGLKERPI